MPSIAIPVSLRGQLLSGARQTLTNILFSNNEPGFTFEPWDTTTLYQDRAGTTPVTAAGQSVGLRLSKDQGLRLGPELVTNGDFSAGATGWTVQAGWTISGGVAVGVNATNLVQVGKLIVGKYYIATITVTDYVSGAIAAGTPTTIGLFATGSGTKTIGFIADSANFYILGTSTFKGEIDDVSVRELTGNHQVAVSDAKRGVYGWMPKTGRRNLLTYTEQFDNAAWVKTSASIAANAAIAPDGTLTADLQIISAQFGGASQFYSGLSTGAAYTVSVWARVDGGSRVYSVVDNSGGGGILGTFTPTTSWVRYNFPLTAGSSSATIFIAQDRSASGFSGVYLWGAQLETGSTATAYQRVVSQYDITEAGVPTCYYVQADGVDDAYVTPTITPNTDKAQVFAGVRKLSDAAIGMVCEFSPNVNTNAGTFWMAAPIGAGAANYDFSSKGTTGQSKSRSGFAAPHSAVLTGLGDISADSVNLRVNGNDAGAFGGDQGTGNYLAYPAYIYGRAGTSLPFNGLDFGHAVRFGPNLDAATIARVESLIARNTPEVTL